MAMSFGEIMGIAEDAARRKRQSKERIAGAANRTALRAQKLKTSGGLEKQSLVNEGSLAERELINKGAKDVQGMRSKSALDVQGKRNEGAYSTQALRNKASKYQVDTSARTARFTEEGRQGRHENPSADALVGAESRTPKPNWKQKLGQLGEGTGEYYDASSIVDPGRDPEGVDALMDAALGPQEDPSRSLTNYFRNLNVTRKKEEEEKRKANPGRIFRRN